MQEPAAKASPGYSCVSPGAWAVYSRPRRMHGHIPLGLCGDDLTLNLDLLQRLQPSAAADVGSLVSQCAAEALASCQRDCSVLDDRTRSVLCDSPAARGGSQEPQPRSRAADMYCLALHCTAAIEALLSRCLGHDKRGVVILKDVMNDERLLLHLPHLFVDICRYLFLPTHLNFRNLVWHGFMSPGEVDSTLVALCLVLQRTLLLNVEASPGLFPAQRYRDFSPCAEHFRLHAPPRRDLSSASFEALVHDSLFAVHLHEELLLSAFDDYQNGYYVKFLLKVIPCIEHGLRLLFCVSNDQYAYMLAWNDSYFSTLDGFGQRSKHQLLLDPDLNVYEHKCCDSGAGEHQPNRLLQTLGSGTYAALIDLFFTDGGGNVRAAFAHGEFNTTISPLFEGVDRTSGVLGIAEVADMVVTVCVNLLSYFRFDSGVSRALCKHVLESTSAGKDVRSVEAHLVVSRLILDKQTRFQPEYVRTSISPTEEICNTRLQHYRSAYHMNSLLAQEIKRFLDDSCHLLQIINDRSEPRIVDERCTDASHRVGNGRACGDKCAPESQVAITISSSEAATQDLRLWEANSKLFQCFPASALMSFHYNCNTMGGPGRIASSAPKLIDLSRKVYDISQELLSTLNDLWQLEPCLTLHKVAHGVAMRRRSPQSKELINCCVDDLLDVIGTTEIPMSQRVDIRMFLACLQLARDLRSLNLAMIRALQEKESLIIGETSHSSDRRQYLTYITCLAPVVSSLSAVAFDVLVCHLFSCGERRSGAVRDTVACGVELQPPCLKAFCNLIPAVAGCLPAPPAENTGKAAKVLKNDKKPVDKILKQIIQVMSSNNVKHPQGALKR